MEGTARIWFTPKQKAELWQRWKGGQCVADIALRPPDVRFTPKQTYVSGAGMSAKGQHQHPHQRRRPHTKARPPALPDRIELISPIAALSY